MDFNLFFLSPSKPCLLFLSWESTGVEKDAFILTGSMEKHHRVTVHLSAETLRNSEDLASHREAEGSGQSAQKFRQPFVFSFLGRKAQGSCTIESHSTEVKQA